MTAIRALIVDDEPLARRGVAQLLAPYRDFEVAGEARNGREALRMLVSERPDLVFLDVQMPGLDGFDVIRIHGPERMPAVVFVTAHDDFAVRAFEAEALDYLVKPLGEIRFRATIGRIRERMRTAGALSLADRLSRLLAGHQGSTVVAPAPPSVPEGTRGIVVPVPNGYRVLDPAEIVRIEAQGDGVRVHTASEGFDLRMPLSDLERRVESAGFLRVHRAAVVRIGAVREFLTDDRSGGGELVLDDGSRVRVSRRRMAEVRDAIRPGGGRG